MPRTHHPSPSTPHQTGVAGARFHLLTMCGIVAYIGAKAATPILLEGPPAAILEACLSSALGFIAFASMIQAYWFKHSKFLDRVLMGVAAFLLFKAGLQSDLLGLALMVAVTLIHKFRR